MSLDPQTIVRESLIRNTFTDPNYLETSSGQIDFDAHLNTRLKLNRQNVIPWLESFTSLRGKKILEIGAGTGASTLALVEAGAEVTAIDIDQPSLQVAYDRCKAYGHTINCMLANVADIKRHFFPEPFDIIIFYATLEHMTHEERRTGMKDTWDMLAKGKHWVVIETPNRLWIRDDHTALLPFYHWLSDDVAFEYARFSKRDFFRENYNEKTPEQMLHFLRRGRGMSYHEFELFIAPLKELNVISCLDLFLRARKPGAQQEWNNSHNGIFEGLLHAFYPELPQAFLQIELNLALQK